MRTQAGALDCKQRMNKGGTTLYIVVQKMTVSEENVQALLDSLTGRTVLSEQPGFVDLTVMKHQDDSRVVGVIGRWEDKDAWAAWENTDTRQEVKSVDVLDVQTDFYFLEGQVK